LTEDMKVEVSETWTTGFGGLTASKASLLGTANYAWTNTKSTSDAIQREKPEERLDDCGYWTFVPYIME
jgi:hypothetical protein